MADNYSLLLCSMFLRSWPHSEPRVLGTGFRWVSEHQSWSGSWTYRFGGMYTKLHARHSHWC